MAESFASCQFEDGVLQGLSSCTADMLRTLLRLAASEFGIVFVALVILYIIIHYAFGQENTQSATSPTFQQFQRRYLIIYGLVMGM